MENDLWNYKKYNIAMKDLSSREDDINRGVPQGSIL